MHILKKNKKLHRYYDAVTHLLYVNSLSWIIWACDYINPPYKNKMTTGMLVLVNKNKSSFKTTSLEIISLKTFIQNLCVIRDECVYCHLLQHMSD